MESENKKGILKAALKAVKLKDVGHQYDKEVTSLKPLKDDSKLYPSIYLSGKDVPFLDDCEVGDKETLVVEAVIRSKNTSQHVNERDTSEYSLEIRKIGKLS